jgi:signal transduction histidine kinase
MRNCLVRGHVVLIAVTVGIAVLVESLWATAGQKQVLTLYSTRRDAQIAIVGDRELQRILERGLPEGLDYHSEFIDQARFPQADYQGGFRDFLRVKYKDQRFDLVIAMGDVSLEFIEKNRDALFTDTPVVFFANHPSPRRLANSTGVSAELNLSGTLALAIQLQPDLKHVFVVSGASESNAAFAGAARTELRSFAQRLEISYLSGLPTTELERRLRSLPDHSIVYYLVVDRDGANQNFHPLEYLDRITAVANAPVYCWVDSAMDHGIVGGSLKDQVAQTHAVAELALRVLHGQRADSIPIVTSDLNVAQVDWRQLRRWGISEARVPARVLVRFREPTAWDRYKFYILAAFAILLAQTVLITGLLVQRARRRRAEERLRGNQAELRASYERIHDLGGRLLNAQETERARLARELHDDISQQMALLEIDLELLGRTVQGGPAGLAGEALNRAQSVARSVHDLSHRLHPVKLRLIGLVAALHGLQRELSSSSDIAIRFTHDNVPATLPPDLTLCVFRVVQEALQNALKYSRARQVSIHMNGGANELALTIADDGEGFDVATAWGKGLGLISMAERLEAIGGTFEIRSQPGAGTRLELRVPFRVAEGTETVAV